MMKNTFCEPGKLQAGSNQGSEPLLQSGKFKSCGMTIRHLVYLYIYIHILQTCQNISFHLRAELHLSRYSQNFWPFY